MFRQIISLFNLNEWVIEFDCELHVAGTIVENDHIIKINPLLGDRVITLIHECLHILHPTWKDKRVEQKATAIYEETEYRPRKYTS